jgi:CRP-like cAMP-binding protein
VTLELETLRASPFFHGFAAEDLGWLAAGSDWRDVEKGVELFAEGEPASSFSLLVSGRIRLSFEAGGSGAASVGGDRVARNLDPLQTISHPGYPIGWSALVPPHAYRATATAIEPTRLLTLERRALEERAEASPRFGLDLMRALITLVGDRLRATRLRIVAQRYDDDALAIRQLLEESGPRLKASSPLHRLPHYLESRLTLADAFHMIDVLRTDGDALERELAALCEDILENVRRELWLYQSLQGIYDSVAGASPHLDARMVRERNMREFQELFRGTRYRIAGLENLPAQPGHLFVMNHLRNNPENLLPNKFILTLDTHFVSSMILFERYGQAPIRVIRKSRPDEYGHQSFYDRLGYVYVYSGHVDPDEDSATSHESRQRLFLDAAGSYLEAGTNVVICPEGTSTSTEESPLRFRPGAFELAAHVEPEPLIVPIAVANFDKKLTRVTTSAVAHEPLRLSDAVRDRSDRGSLLRFLNDELRPRFEAWVKEAVALAARGH